MQKSNSLGGVNLACILGAAAGIFGCIFGIVLSNKTGEETIFADLSLSGETIVEPWIYIVSALLIIVIAVFYFLGIKIGKIVSLGILAVIDLIGLFVSLASIPSDLEQGLSQMIGVGNGMKAGIILQVLGFLFGAVALILMIVIAIKPNIGLARQTTLIGIIGAIGPVLIAIGFYIELRDFFNFDEHGAGVVYALLFIFCLLYAAASFFFAKHVLDDKQANAPQVANVTEKLGTIKDKVSQTVVKPEKEGPEALLKYKELLDLGILTEEEFELKKKQILGQ